MHLTAVRFAGPFASTLALAAALMGTAAQATPIVTALPNGGLTTADNVYGPDNDGTGVWFNPLTGYAESRGYYWPDTYYTDGQFFLYKWVPVDTYGAGIYTQGFFSRGNTVIYTSANDLNLAHFGVGTAIGAGTGYQVPGAGFVDIGPNYGHWAAGDRGFIGLVIRDPSGASASDVFYGYADITVQADWSITLNGMAYESTRGAAITTAYINAVPEPATSMTLALGLAALAAGARFKRRR